MLLLAHLPGRKRERVLFAVTRRLRVNCCVEFRAERAGRSPSADVSLARGKSGKAGALAALSLRRAQAVPAMVVILGVETCHGRTDDCL